jgi:tRNA splicing endonuclease
MRSCEVRGTAPRIGLEFRLLFKLPFRTRSETKLLVCKDSRTVVLWDISRRFPLVSTIHNSYVLAIQYKLAKFSTVRCMAR